MDVEWDKKTLDYVQAERKNSPVFVPFIVCMFWCMIETMFNADVLRNYVELQEMRKFTDVSNATFSRVFPKWQRLIEQGASIISGKVSFWKRVVRAMMRGEDMNGKPAHGDLVKVRKWLKTEEFKGGAANVYLFSWIAGKWKYGRCDFYLVSSLQNRIMDALTCGDLFAETYSPMHTPGAQISKALMEYRFEHAFEQQSRGILSFIKDNPPVWVKNQMCVVKWRSGQKMFVDMRTGHEYMDEDPRPLPDGWSKQWDACEGTFIFWRERKYQTWKDPRPALVLL